jgi:hypothetical protein
MATAAKWKWKPADAIALKHLSHMGLDSQTLQQEINHDPSREEQQGYKLTDSNSQLP